MTKVENKAIRIYRADFRLGQVGEIDSFLWTGSSQIDKKISVLHLPPLIIWLDSL